MSNPYRFSGNTLLSFSGGRTSGYMLRKVLDAYDGVLPDNIKVVYANTGREHEGTLQFVDEVSRRWSVPVVWLEFNHGYPYEGAFRRKRWADIVSFETAARNGEPFDRLLESRKIVPDRSRRFCTQELKVATIQRYLNSLGWDTWNNVIGFRADESMRVRRKIEKENPEGPFRSVFPLVTAGVDEFEVLRAWKSGEYGFDLNIPEGCGNCDGCFMFPSERIAENFRRDPEKMQWWVDMESRYGPKTMRHGEPYAEIQERALLNEAQSWGNGAACEESCGV